MTHAGRRAPGTSMHPIGTQDECGWLRSALPRSSELVVMSMADLALTRLCGRVSQCARSVASAMTSELANCGDH
jgi:hypothetical protein